MTQAYPLAWPPGWPRTEAAKREGSRMRTTLSAALKNVETEVRLIGGKGMVLSSNVTLGATRPADPGVAVYFDRSGDQVAIPCDRWSKVEDNLQAIAKTIEALRGIERWGAKHMVKAAFRGFAALPPPGAQRPWRAVLGLSADAQPTASQVDARYRTLAITRHPDHGGSQAAMAELNRARDEAKSEVEA